MKYTFLLSVAIALIATCYFYSCTKIQHKTNPIPANVQMLSYTKVTTIAGATTTDNYRFFYNSSGKVSQILYTSNDSFQKNTSSVFTYSNDTIYKAITLVKPDSLIETDTFVNYPGTNNIEFAYLKNSQYQFTYYNGSLLSLETKTIQGDSGTSISANTIYTSDNIDWIKRSFDGNLTAQFSDSGIQMQPFPHDTLFVEPFTVTWTAYGATPSVSYTHTNINNYSDQLNYNSGGPISISVVDANGAILRDMCTFPKDLSATQYYGIWQGLFNRTGDYLQLESIVTFGTDVYNNAHLLKSIYNPYDTTNIVYTIDANSLVTQTYATTMDNQTGLKTEVYKIQYQTN